EAAFGGSHYFHAPLGSSFSPAVAAYNVFQSTSGKPKPRTPLFIGFSRNHHMLTQTILSFIAAGWPRDEIIVVDNSGTMNANSNGKLTEQNPFYLNYDRLRSRYGVNVLRTPTLLTFAQLQNFFISEAVE